VVWQAAAGSQLIGDINKTARPSLIAAVIMSIMSICPLSLRSTRRRRKTTITITFARDCHTHCGHAYRDLLISEAACFDDGAYQGAHETVEGYYAEKQLKNNPFPFSFVRQFDP